MVDLVVSSAPDLVSWDITSRCNLRCAHCYAGSDHPPQSDLTESQCKAILDQIADAGTFQVVFLGGEPLMRPDFIDLVSYSRELGLDVGFSTNGTLITKPRAQTLASLDLHGIQVSIDSPSERLHDQFRGIPGCWDQTVQGARLLVESGCPVIIATVITKFNCDQLPDMVRLAVDIGAKELRTLRLIPVGRGVNCLDIMVNPQDVLRIASTLDELRQEFAGQLDVRKDESFPFLTNKDNTPEFCTAGTTTCSIKVNGSVYPCSYFEGEEFNAGNVTLTPFLDIWQNGVLRNFRKQPLISGPCSGCILVSNCKGGCRAAAYNASFEHSAPDPYCLIPKQGGDNNDLFS